jgi:subfamily B ATP-binding cassette protein MsbA
MKKRSVQRRLLEYILPHWRLILFSAVASAVASAIESSLPIVVGKVIDVLGGDTNIISDLMIYLGFKDTSWAVINVFPFYVILVIVLGGLFSFSRIYLITLAGQRAVLKIRTDLFKNLQGLSLAYFDRTRSGEFISRVVNDVSNLQDTANSLKDLFHSIIMVVVIITVMFIRHWQLTLLAIITFPLLVKLINYFGEKMKGKYRNIQERIAGISTYLHEMLGNIRIIKAFSREDYEEKRFDEVNVESYKSWMESTKVEALLKPLMELCAGAGMVLVFWVGCRKIMSGSLTTGGLIEFIGLVIILYQPIKMFGRVNTLLQRAYASGERVFEVMDEVDKIVESPEAVDIAIEGDIEFDDVYFSYDGSSDVLKGINLHIEKNEVVALVGPSGAGKTTLVNLIPRLYDVTAGAVRVDGVDVRDLKKSSLRGQIGMVLQETTLFAMSVKKNILYGRLDATDEEIIEASKMANAYDFIMKMDSGYDSFIGERGVQLSGGQRQRIAIARAFLSDPGILIMDEATSSLDVESERLIKEAMERLISDRTTIIIAHRLSTVINADRIVVLDEGEIVEEGTHNSLIENGGLYERLYQTQFLE